MCVNNGELTPLNPSKKEKRGSLYVEKERKPPANGTFRHSHCRLKSHTHTAGCACQQSPVQPQFKRALQTIHRGLLTCALGQSTLAVGGATRTKVHYHISESTLLENTRRAMFFPSLSAHRSSHAYKHFAFSA